MKRSITVYSVAKNMNLHLEKIGLCVSFVKWAHDKCTSGQSSKTYFCDFCQTK